MILPGSLATVTDPTAWPKTDMSASVAALGREAPHACTKMPTEAWLNSFYVLGNKNTIWRGGGDGKLSMRNSKLKK